MPSLNKEIRSIKARNARVEADKAWETSWTRRGIIFAATYIIIAVFLSSISAPNPFVNALIPAIGYVLSTLTFPFIKNLWAKRFYRR